MTRLYNAGKVYMAKRKKARPKVFIPVFPGTIVSMMARAFEAGADVETLCSPT